MGMELTALVQEQIVKKKKKKVDRVQFQGKIRGKNIRGNSTLLGGHCGLTWRVWRYTAHDPRVERPNTSFAMR